MFGKKKPSVIDRRLRELQREMEQVRSELKSAERPAPPAPLRPVGGLAPPEPPARPARDADLFGGPGRPAPGSAEAPSLFDPVDAAPPAARRKFASYFMAGHFQNLRPTRHDSRVLRNKAIIMIVLVLALLAWLIYYFQAH